MKVNLVLINPTMDLSLIENFLFIVKVFSQAKDYIQNSAEFPEPGLGDEENITRVHISPCSSSRGYYAGAKSKPHKQA